MSVRSYTAALAVALASTAPAAEPSRADAFGDPLPAGARLRLGTGRWRAPGAFPGYLRALALTPDAKTVIVSGYSGTALIDAASGRALTAPAVRLDSSPNAVLIARDGRTIVACDYNYIATWDLREGKQLGRIQTDGGGRFDTFALDDSGRFVIASARHGSRPEEVGKVVVWDLAAGKAAAAVEVLQNESVRGVMSPDGKLLATYGRHYDRRNGGNPQAENPSAVIQIWDIAAAKEKLRFKTDHGYQVSTARFTSDGRTLATAGGALIQLWDAATGKLVRNFAARSGQGVALFFSPDGKQLASTGGDGSIQLWETATARRLGICERVCPLVYDLVFPPSGPPVALGLRNSQLALWTVPDGRQLIPESGHSASPLALQFSAGGKALHSLEVDGRILDWDAVSGKHRGTTQIRFPDREEMRYPYRQFTAEFSPAARWLAVTNDSGRRALADARTGVEQYTFWPTTANHGRPHSPAFSADGSRVASFSLLRDPTGRSVQTVAHVWDADTGQLIASVPSQGVGNSYDTHATCALAPDGTRLVIGTTSSAGAGRQFSATAVDVATGKTLGRHSGPGNHTPVVPVIAPDGRSALLPGPNGGAFVWDLVSGMNVRDVKLNRPVAPVSPRLAPDGRFVALVLQEQVTAADAPTRVRHSIVVLEWASGEKRAEFPLPDGVTVSALAVGPDGRTVAAGCSDTSILLYDLSPEFGPRP